MLENITLSQEQQQIIFGGLLGDSYFNKKRKIIRFSHSIKQKEYLEWKFSKFKKEDVHGLYRRNYKEVYVNYSFEIINKQNENREMYEFLYKHLYANDGRKKISLRYLKELSPLALAVWWMDDGHLSVHHGNRYGKLCTHCFNYEENILIQKYFKAKWDISVDIKQEKGKYYFIKLNVTELKKLISIIYTYVCEIPSMIYKVDLNYVNNVKLGDFKDVYEYIKSKT